MSKQPIQLKQVGPNLTIKVEGKLTRLTALTDEVRENLLKAVSQYNMYYRGKDLLEVQKILKKIQEKPKEPAVVAARIEKKKVTKEIKEVARDGIYARYKNIPGLEVHSNKVALEGFEFALPDFVLEKYAEWYLAGESLDPIKNFVLLLAHNPNEVVRKDLFKWLVDHHFMLTPAGYIVSYRYANVKSKGENPDLVAAIGRAYAAIRLRKKATEKFSLYTLNGEYAWDWSHKVPNGANVAGVVKELYLNLGEQQETVYTDKHTGTFEIRLGQVVEMDRKLTNENAGVSCSSGLHQGSIKWVRNDSYGSQLLMCLVNPSDIVAIPGYESKFRCCRYFPVAEIKKSDLNKIEEDKLRVYDGDYEKINIATIEAQVKASQGKLEFPLNAERENLIKLKGQLKDLKVQNLKGEHIDHMSADDHLKILNSRIQLAA